MAVTHSNGVYGRFLLHTRFTKAFLGNRVNKEDQFVYVKYHFICDQGPKPLAWGEAKKKYGQSQGSLIHTESWLRICRWRPGFL